MEEKEKNIDFIRCEKCKLPINDAKIDFNMYHLPRFVDKCKRCEFSDRKLLEKPKEDLINSIKIAETFHKFCKDELGSLSSKFLEFEHKFISFKNSIKSDIENQYKQISHNHYELDNKIKESIEDWNKKYLLTEEFHQSERIQNELYEELNQQMNGFSAFFDIYLKSQQKKPIDFSKFPSFVTTLLKKQFIFIEEQLQEIIDRKIFINRLGQRSISKIKEYLNSKEK